MLKTCNTLLQQDKHKLVVFTLKGLFRDLCNFYENEPVIVEEEKILTAGLAEGIEEILDNIDQTTLPDLEKLISLYLSNEETLKNLKSRSN